MLLRLLRRQIRHGTLRVAMPNGREHVFGEGPPEAEWIITSPRAPWRILCYPELNLGESYMDGEWHAGDGDLARLLGVLLRNFPVRSATGLERIARLPLTLWQHWNRVAASRQNVARHYDIDEWLFRRFLDEDMHYSCAYFVDPDITLGEAQQAKCRHIARKLLLEPGQRVLDIGSGWGGLALYLAKHYGVQVTGITLSRRQLDVAQARAREQGVEDQVRFELADYRNHRGRYDRIVSVGMFEHVGRPYYRRFFQQIGDLLHPNGVALVHTIGQFRTPSSSNAWIRRHIFPGGCIPALGELSHAAGHAVLTTTDVEVWRLHYAYTLAAWMERFKQHRQEVEERLGERFFRMWEFYLASCEAAFRWRELAVFQMQLAHRIDAVPLTRDYLGASVGWLARDETRRRAGKDESDVSRGRSRDGSR
ncbi:MAG: cyclopropane-fatty-acyl-phospholipid synthase family protein [Gammaproteobacteria bacterium]|nr:cyclopropane-fatty-acyl-phospholipid synthase family protein [Gammaproteobacteria bacterium]